MPPTGGIGFGIDRMCNAADRLRSYQRRTTVPDNEVTQGAAKECCKQRSTGCTGKGCSKDLAEKVDFSNVKIEPIFEEMVDFDTFAKSDFRAVKILACEAVPKSKKLLKFTSG